MEKDVNYALITSTGMYTVVCNSYIIKIMRLYFPIKLHHYDVI